MKKGRLRRKDSSIQLGSNHFEPLGVGWGWVEGMVGTEVVTLAVCLLVFIEMSVFLGWLAINRHQIGASGLHDRLDDLETAVAQILQALLAKLQNLEELVPQVNLTHNANPLAPLFEALAQNFANKVQRPSPSRDDEGRFAGEVIEDGSTKE